MISIAFQPYLEIREFERKLRGLISICMHYEKVNITSKYSIVQLSLKAKLLSANQGKP